MGNIRVSENSVSVAKEILEAQQTENQQKPLATLDGKFFVGMTRKQAEDADLYSRLFADDFKKADKDGDEVLSDEEILDCRKIQTFFKRYFSSSQVFFASGLMVYNGLKLALRVPILALACGACALGLIKSGFEIIADAQMEDDKSEEYRIQHGIKV